MSFQDLLDYGRIIVELATAVLAFGAAWESKKNGRRATRIEKELALNPEKSADAIQKRANGSQIIIENPTHHGEKEGSK